MRAHCNSAFSNAMFTLDGHSFVQALHERQFVSAASISSQRKTSLLFMPRISSAARMAFALPRVDMISSPVAMNVGHIVAVSLRQPPQPLHCSRFAANDPSRAANASTGSNGNFTAAPTAGRKFLKEQVGEEMYLLMRQIKKSFDPHNVFNPGKLIDDGRYRKTILQSLNADVYAVSELVSEARLASIISQMPGYDAGRAADRTGRHRQHLDRRRLAGETGGDLERRNRPGRVQ